MEFNHMVHLSFLLILMLWELAFISYYSIYPYYSIIYLNLLEWIIGISTMEPFVCFHFTVYYFICICFISCFDLYFKRNLYLFCFSLTIFMLIILHLSFNLISLILFFIYLNLCFAIVNNYFAVIYFIDLLGF